MVGVLWVVPYSSLKYTFRGTLKNDFPQLMDFLTLKNMLSIRFNDSSFAKTFAITTQPRTEHEQRICLKSC